ncbi:MAG TPA: DUF559 domain-containing protein [Microbacterium sp.]|nr:DUF559 domain-containing protein [Microbacterium sp.]
MKRWLRGRDDRSVRLHWGHLRDPAEARHVVSLRDALMTLIRCQPARAVVATLDNLLFLAVITMDELRDVFAALPARYDVLLRLVDGRCESGPESLLRLTLRQMGLRFEVQAEIDGVGRVDFLVEGCLIIECDSKAFHEGWAAQKRDRRRDLAAASRGLMTLRLLAEDIMYHPGVIAPAIRELLAAHVHCRV